MVGDARGGRGEGRASQRFRGGRRGMIEGLLRSYWRSCLVIES